MDLSELDFGSIDAPTPLLPMIVCLIPLCEVHVAIGACQILCCAEVTEDATEFLEGELIDDNIGLLSMTEIAIVEWGPDWGLGHELIATVYTLPIAGHGELSVVRWREGIPRWWCYGHIHQNVEQLVAELEKQVGRGPNRILDFRMECRGF